MEKPVERFFDFLFEGSADSELAFVHPQEISYGKMKLVVWSLAEKLKTFNLDAGSIVLPVLSKGLKFGAGYFSALMSKLVPLIMDTSNRGDLNKVAGRISLVLTEESLLEGLASVFPREKIVVVDAFLDRKADPPASAGPFSRNDTMSILLTSGSTGDPKVNVKSYGNVLDELAILKGIHQISSSDIYCCAVPWVHIYGFLNGFLLPLSEGAAIAAPGMFLPHEAARLIGTSSVFLGVPVHYRALLETAGLSKGGLRLALSSGAHLSDMISRRFYELTGLPITEIYGSTEMGGIASRQSPLEPGWSCFPGVAWKLGEDSELLVRSPMMNDSLFEDVPGKEEGWYPSGDCAKVLEDGKFQLDGRKAGIMKIGGKRVSVKEIEEALFATGVVSDTVVASFASPGISGEKIGALVVLKEGAETKRADLRQKCCETLPSFKVPDKIVFVEKIPRAQTGKVRLSDVDRLMKRGGKE